MIQRWINQINQRERVDIPGLRAILRIRRKLLRTKPMKDVLYYLDRHNRRSRASRQPKWFTCFFTGMTLPKRVDPWSGYTIEHLVPKSLLKPIPQNLQRKMKFDRYHRVPAISIINHMIGHAPLVVKFGLRDYLKSQKPARLLTEDERIEFYVHHTRLYLEQFKVSVGEHKVNHMPWYYSSMEEQEYRDKLFEVYYNLLTGEERILLLMRD